MADTEDFHNDGYAREQAISTKLEGYLGDCLRALKPRVSISCKVRAKSGSATVVCELAVDESAIEDAEQLIASEIRIVSRKDDAVASRLEYVAVIPAIIKHHGDSADQVFELVLSKARYQLVMPAPTILRLTEANDSDPNYGCPASEMKHVILLIHGIRDIGAWQNNVSRHLTQRGTQVEQIRYGYYPEVQFLFPLDLSGGPVKRVLKRIRALQNQYPNAMMSVIAHSFGTYVFLKALEADSDLEFWKVIFCGSVADDQFEWSDLKRRVGHGNRLRATRDFVLNDCGTGDAWPILGTAFGWHYGMAGATGFSEGFVTNRFHRAVGGTKGGHGVYFDPKFVLEKWKPFLIDDLAPSHGDGEQGEHIFCFVRLLYHGWMRLICKVVAAIIWLSIAAALVIGISWIWSLLVNIAQRLS